MLLWFRCVPCLAVVVYIGAAALAAAIWFSRSAALAGRAHNRAWACSQWGVGHVDVLGSRGRRPRREVLRRSRRLLSLAALPLGGSEWRWASVSEPGYTGTGLKPQHAGKGIRRRPRSGSNAGKGIRHRDLERR